MRREALIISPRFTLGDINVLVATEYPPERGYPWRLLIHPGIEHPELTPRDTFAPDQPAQPLPELPGGFLNHDGEPCYGHPTFMGQTPVDADGEPGNYQVAEHPVILCGLVII